MLAVYHGFDDAPIWVPIALAAVTLIVLIVVVWYIVKIVRSIWRYFRERTNR